MIVGCVTALNEESTIGALVHGLQLYCAKVVVIDDGSNDRTASEAWASGADVRRHFRPKGIGPSLMEAWRIAILSGADRILQIDAGGSHLPEEAYRLLCTEAELVIGSRFVPGSVYLGQPVRGFLSRLASTMCNLTQDRLPIRDWTSGYRVFTRHMVKYLLNYDYLAHMHAWQVEVLKKVCSSDAMIREVPITYIPSISSLTVPELFQAFRVWIR